MPGRNPLRGENQPQDQANQEHLANIRARKVIEIGGIAGPTNEVTLNEHSSESNPDGTYGDTDRKRLVFDASGAQLDQDRLGTLAISHTGLFINDFKNEGAICTYPSHRGANRLIKVGFDGRKTNDGAICSNCQNMRNFRLAGIIIVAFGVIAGIYKAIWF